MGTFDCPICLDSHLIVDGCISCSPFDNKQKSIKTHIICIDCIRGFSKSAIENNQIAEGGVGLCCPDPECPNIIPISKYHCNFIINLFYF